MSGGEPAEPQAEETGEPEPRQMSERTAKILLAVAGMLAAWGIIAAAPWLAYVIVGALLTMAWQKVRRWVLARRDDETELEPEDDDEEENLLEAMHRLARPHVFLVDLADARGLSKETTRALLDALGIRIRRAVRNGDDTGVGVHKDDIPPLPQVDGGTPVSGVDLQQQHNQQPGVRIKRTDGGMTIYDLADNHRHHEVPKSGRRTSS